MSRLAAALAFLLLTALPVSAAILGDMRRTSVAEDSARYVYLEKFFEGYYMQKDAAQIPFFLNILDRSRMLEDYPSTQTPIAAFLAAIMADNKDKAAGWLTPSAPYRQQTRDVLLYAAWLAGLSDGPVIARFYDPKPDYLGKTPPKWIGAPVLDLNILDSLWGAYLATGDVSFVSRIADAACGKQDAEGRLPLPDTGLQRNASNALYEYAKAHESVRRLMLRRQFDNEGPCGNGQLKQILPPPLQMEKMDGEFGATMSLADYKDARFHMDMHVKTVMDLPGKSRVKPGDKVAVLVAYSGMGMNDDLTTNVEMDSYIEGPDGKPVDKSAIKRKPLKPLLRAGRYAMLNPASFSAVEFKKEYQAGKYIFHITLRDNIGKREVKLSRSLTFKPD